MQLNPYLTFNGQCEEAFGLYAKCLGGTIEMMMPNAGSPAAEMAPAGWADKILHATLSFNGQLLMATDAPPGQYDRSRGMHVAVQVDTVEDAERIFATLAEGGRIDMPMQPTFWTVRFGMLVDRFGIPWMISGPAA